MKKFLGLLLTAVLLLSLAACGAQDSPAGTQQTPSNSPSSAPTGGNYVITFGCTGSEQTSDYAGASAFKEYVEEASNGQITCNLMFNGVLGSDRETLESVQMGSCTVTTTGLTQNTNFVPELAVLDSPFLFQTAEDVNNLFADEEFASELSALYSNAGFKFVGMTFQGFRTLTSNREVHKMSDMKGMTIRVIEAPTPLALWSALGANPTPLAFTEVYTALQQGTVDAQENPLELIYSQKFYEQQDYIISTNHQIQPIFWVMNLGFYNGLPEDLKKVVDDGFEAGLAASKEYSAQMEATYKQTMLDSGCVFLDIDSAAHDEMYTATESVRQSLADQYPAFFDVTIGGVERTKS